MIELNNYRLIELGDLVLHDFYTIGNLGLKSVERAFNKYQRAGLIEHFSQLNLGKILSGHVNPRERFYMFEDESRTKTTTSSLPDNIVAIAFLPREEYADNVVVKFDFLWGNLGDVVSVSSRGLNQRKWDKALESLSKKP